MPLNFAPIEEFLADNGEAMKGKGLPRHERRRILADLHDRLEFSLREYEEFESRFRSLLSDGIEKASSLDELKQLHHETVAEVERYFLEEDSPVDVHDLLRTARDAITIRVLKLVEEEMEEDGYGYPPSRYVWVGMGSEGRDEQTIATDQDNMIIFGEEREGPKGSFTEYLIDTCYDYFRDMGIEDGFEKITEKQVIDYYYTVFSEKIVERLHQVGFEKCKGNVMPSNRKWRGTLGDWKERLEQRLVYQRGIFEPLDLVIMTDARYMAGDRQLLEELLEHFFRLLTNHKAIMKEFIQTAVIMPTALSFFGNFKVEKNGAHRDMLNLKLQGWAPLIFAVRMLALSNGIYEPNTIKRIRLLRAMNIVKKDMENDLIDAYFIFVKFRIMNQMGRRNTENHMDLSYLRPDMLGPQEEERLRKAMKSVETLQKFIQSVLLFGQTV